MYIGSSLSQCCQENCCVVHIFKRSSTQTSHLLSRPSAVLKLYHVNLPQVNSKSLYTLIYLKYVTYFVSLMGDTLSLPVMSLFLPTSTHYPRIRIRKHLVAWNLNASMEGFLVFDSGFTSMALDWKIRPSVLLQLIISHLMDCTRVHWGSLTSMVISLPLVNDIHQLSVIKWFLPCLNSTPVITWIDLYFETIEMNTLDITISVQVAVEHS
jgi:hypothetical protein